MTALGIDRTHGQDVRNANVNAVTAVAAVLKSSLGPQGLDKMMVDSVGEMIITNDGATILSKLEINHPAAKVIQELSKLQDSEVGDGTTSVVLIASELLKRGNELIKDGLHASLVIQGYRTAMRECVDFVTKNMAIKIRDLSSDVITNVARTSLNSKFVGRGGGMFPEMIIDALNFVKFCSPVTGKIKYPVDQVNIVRSHGKSSTDSELHKSSYVLAQGRASQSMLKSVRNARVVLLDFDLRKARMGLGVKVSIEDPNELEKIRQKEMDITKCKIDVILAIGVNVILTTGGIDDMAMKYLIDKGVIGLRRVPRVDLNKLAKAMGTKVMLTLTGIDDWEVDSIDASYVGTASSVNEQRVGDNDFFFIHGTSGPKPVATILLRAANEYIAEEVERSLHDSLCATSKALESGAIVGGGGCVETALSLHLEKIAQKHDGKEQLAILQFAAALMCIPKILCMNAAIRDVTSLISSLRVAHNSGKNTAGIDLVNGTVCDSITSGVVEPIISKLKSIKFATEAAVTILRIDDHIKPEPEPEQRDPRMG